MKKSKTVWLPGRAIWAQSQLNSAAVRGEFKEHIELLRKHRDRIFQEYGLEIPK